MIQTKKNMLVMAHHNELTWKCLVHFPVFPLCKLSIPSRRSSCSGGAGIGLPAGGQGCFRGSAEYDKKCVVYDIHAPTHTHTRAQLFESVAQVAHWVKNTQSLLYIFFHIYLFTDFLHIFSSQFCMPFPNLLFLNILSMLFYYILSTDTYHVIMAPVSVYNISFFLSL